MSASKFYDSWYAMHRRCYSPAYACYHRYGGRGITVCQEWHSFECFKADMYSTWFEGATLDRINNDGNYEYINCRWMPKSQNAKPLKYPILEMLDLYNKGMTQSAIARQYGTHRPHVTILLQRARRVTKI